MGSAPLDIESVKAAQDGDQAAFAALTLAVSQHLHRVAYGILRDPYLAEDATQQALVKVWQKLPRLRDPERFEAFCYRFVVRACYEEANRRKRSLASVIVAREPVAADDIGAVDDRDQLERAFRKLSVEQRAVVVLHHYMHMTVDEVAATLDVPRGTVASRLSRAIDKLRLALHVDIGPDPAAQPEARR